MFITGRCKGGYLTGTTAKPATTDAKNEQWNNEDNLVRYWLISTMEPKIGDTYLLHKSAKSIWDHAKRTYSTVANSSALFEIETKIFSLKQEGMSATEYYNKLSSSWLQLDLYEAQEWTTAEDAETFRKFISKKRTYQFLLGLSQDLDDVKGRIISTKPFPEIEDAFAEIRREEYRRQLMLSEVKTEGSALIAEKPGASLLSQKFSNSKEKETTTPWYCEHCKKPWHTKDECWELKGGKPPGWKSKSEKRAMAKNPRANTVAGSSSSDNNQFSQGQMDALQNMFNQVMKGFQSTPTTTTPESFSSMFSKGSGLRDGDWQD
ncbi:hypothetical protein LINPERPRIM_LOCUS12625 [Linum perenne]